MTEQKGSSIFEVMKLSDTFKEAKYITELHLGSVEVEITKVQKIKIFEISQKFKAYCESSQLTNKVYSVILVDDLDSSNNVQNIIERGFTIPAVGGLMFPCGYIPHNMKEGRVYKAILCQIAIKNSKIATSSEISPHFLDTAQKSTVYDSVQIVE